MPSMQRALHTLHYQKDINMTNKERFKEELRRQYESLYASSEEYAFAKKRRTPSELAEMMTEGLADATANKDGEGIKRTCKALGIKHTYRAIEEFLQT